MKVDFKPTRKGLGQWLLIFGVIFCIGLFLNFGVEPNLIGGDIAVFQTIGWVVFVIGLAGLALGTIFLILFITVVRFYSLAPNERDS